MTGWLQIAAVFAALAIVHRPLGDYLAWAFSAESDWRLERVIYRFTRVDAKADQRWPTYLRSLLTLSGLSVLVVYALLRLQFLWPGLGREAMPPAQAWNTAASFVTNTNWQSYSGETLSQITQAAGLTVQNFLSAAVGLAVAMAFVRGLARNKSETIGNFWVDVTRASTRVLAPLAVVAALILLLGGVVQTLGAPIVAHLISGGTQTIPVGPIASQEAIKLLGTNGGGFFAANSAHPFENPSWWTNLVEIFLILLIPSSLPRAFGKLVGDTRQGWAVLASMSILFALSLVGVLAAELNQPNAMEGRELRFGTIPSAFFAVATTMTSTGAVDSMHSSYSPFGGGLLLTNMILGEISPGGVGSGLYGMLVIALVTVFLAGLMVGRTPEYLGKKVGVKEIKLATLTLLTAPLLVLSGSALAVTLPGQNGAKNPGPHGLTEVLYAFASAANNNGSAFAGLAADTPFFNVSLGVIMLLGRFLPIIFILALAAAFARQDRVPASSGTLPTHSFLFVAMTVIVALIVAALTFLPALALGPLAEGLA